MKNIIRLFLIIFPSILFAQDARFSQYFNDPLLINPALAGNGIEFIRLTAIYRNQWAGIGNPYTTQGFAVDKKVNKIGLGGIITRNSAGDAGINSLNVSGNIAYNLPIGSEKINVISTGLQVGIINRSFDESKMKFDNQYTPDGGYDPNISSGEIFTATSVTRPDVNFGLMWQRGWLHNDIKFKPYFGVSFAHINRPSETFIVDNNKTAIKKTYYAGAGYQLSEKTEIRPSLIMMRQDLFQETTFGSMVNFKLDNKNSLQLGVYNRFNDAVIAYAGYQMNLLFVGMSYDVNTSDLSKSGKGNNAFEISLTYSPRPKRAKEPQEVILTKEPKITLLNPIQILENKIELPDSLTARNIEYINVHQEELNVEKQVTGKHEKTLPVISILRNEPVVSHPIISDKKVNETIPKIEKPNEKIVIAKVSINDFDNDGIADNDDECPYIKGSAATHGCPDSDGDGIPDLLDDCPMENGSAAHNGCPDVNSVNLVVGQQLIKKFDNILFSSGIAKLRTDDIYDIIERAIDILYADKSAMVILSGHTDSEGDALQNMYLSQSRIEVVKKYMIRQGIDEKRISAVAYGETMPLENNNTSDGKQMNRRVEINILKKK